jgi:hypothetical protein
MQVLSVRCGLTKNLGNYESAKLEVEAAPSDGQTSDQLLAEVNDYLSKQVEAAVSNAGGVKEKPAKKKSMAPLAKSGESSDSDYTNGVKDAGAPFKADPTQGDSTPDVMPAKQTSTEKPMTPRSMVKAGKTALDAEKANGKAQNKANVNAPDPKKELKYALEAETLDELLERFNGLRKMAADFGDGWEAAVTKIADRYRKLNSLDANPETLDAIVKAFKAERTAIEKMKSEAVAA